MPAYYQQETNTDRYITEDGTGAYLLETSTVLATVTGGGAPSSTGAKGALSTASVTGGGTVTATGAVSTPAVERETGGNVLLRPPKRQRLPRRPIDKTGDAHTTGTGHTTAHGRAQHANRVSITASGTVTAHGYKTTYAPTLTRARGTILAFGRSAVAETNTLDDEFRQLLEDVVVLIA